ncbi:helix-turn-helix transcriptional regulator [Methanobrevibacter filiformis]|uniref:Methanogenesis regulatory protein FilR1 middle domain-containing protein n=1 Tax=Methanobrevibacter filiformis TaxID=55758 RepID=A0A162FEV1_9EURY|nr:transcriptional regulator FilR1 domain-containing protein [Methanobrevibacter filiformis]KZX12035.1 hypothetical protein MBFIL_12670 [Methanobrevibacter filiformis]
MKEIINDKYFDNKFNKSNSINFDEINNNEKLVAYVEDCLFNHSKFFLTSKIKSSLLIFLLNNNGKNLEEIRKYFKKPSASLSHGLKELENVNLVFKKNKYYFLTSLGYIISLNLVKLVNNFMFIKNQDNFWKNHDISGIPLDFFNNIYYLDDVECITCSQSDIFKVPKIYGNIFSKSEKLKLVLPFFSSDYLNPLFNQLGLNLPKLEIVTIPNIFEHILDNYHDKLKYLDVWIIDEDVLNLFLTSSDKSISLGLNDLIGIYDNLNMLFSSSENSIKWANDLIDYYKEKGEKISCYDK